MPASVDSGGTENRAEDATEGGTDDGEESKENQ
jgi:hypothetical protein